MTSFHLQFIDGTMIMGIPTKESCELKSILDTFLDSSRALINPNPKYSSLTHAYISNLTS